MSPENAARLRHPSASYSVTIRTEYDNRPGMLARVTSAIGEAGGDIGAIDIGQRRSRPHDPRRHRRGPRRGAQRADRREARAVEGVKVVTFSDRTFLVHLGGKITVNGRVPVKTRDDLSMVYTPGVGRVCVAIRDDPAKQWALTIKKHTVAVVSDGSAVLGSATSGRLARSPSWKANA